MKKRILSTLLCLMMVLSLLPAAWAATEEIRSVSLTISAPVHGSRPGYTAECGVGSYEVANMNIGGFTNGVKWYDDTTQKQMDSTLDTCVSGHNYTVTVYLEPADPDQFSFKHPVTATVNGHSAETTSTGGGVLVSYQFRYSYDTVEATVDAPLSGKIPGSFQPALSTSGVNLYAYDWFDDDGNVLSKTTSTFRAGETYRLKIRASSANLAFTSHTTASINGANAIVEQADGSTILFYRDFIATMDGHELGSVGLAVTAPQVGKTPSYSATLVPSTMTVTNRSMGSNEYCENGVAWYDNGTHTYLKPTDAFQAGHSYQVSVGWLKPASGDKLATSSYDEITATAAVNGENASISGSATNFIVSYTFPELAAPATTPSTPATTPSTPATTPSTPAVKTIEAVSLTIAAPKAGEKTSFSAGTAADANYTVKSVNWFCDEDNAYLKTGDTYGKKTYILNVTLTPKSGYSFANDILLKGTLNGEDAQARRLEDGSALVTKYFPLIESGRSNPFTDVKESDYYYNAVLWAYYAEPQVTNGVGNKMFGPDSTVTRGQAMTFLWRAAGCPEPKSAQNRFSDIKPNDYWYKAILWASEKGIANGTGNGQYSPNMTCSRAHIVTFLYRTAGEPNKTGTGTWYTDAVNWANANKIITGTAEVFNPSADCPRSDVVLYLFRQLAK